MNLTYRVAENFTDDEFRLIGVFGTAEEAIAFAQAHAVPQGWSGDLIVYLSGDGIVAPWWDDIDRMSEPTYKGKQ